MTNPKPDKLPRVVRGGGWDSSFPAGVRATIRFTGAPAGRSSGLGFRCALRGRQPVRA